MQRSPQEASHLRRRTRCASKECLCGGTEQQGGVAVEVRGLTLLDADVPGSWEQNGSHMHGDPRTEERYGGRGLTQHDINQLRNLSKKP